MKLNLKRLVSGATAFAVVAGTASLINAPAAFAAGTLQGSGQVTNPSGAPLASGGSATAFQLRLPLGASCGGDSTNSSYRVQSYMVPNTVDPSTLQFNASGPVPNAVGASFRQPLYDTTGSPYVDKLTANQETANGPGLIIGGTNFDYAVFVPGNIPQGAYNIGIACTLGPASATQMKEYWNIQKTFTTSATDSPAGVTWAVGATPVAPVLNTVVSSGGTAGGALTANYTSTASDPATSSYTVTATPTAGGTPVTATSASPTSTQVTGLTNGAQYSVTVKATNSVGDSPQSNAITATPVQQNHPAIQNLAATPGTGKVDLSWNPPADAGTTAPTGYTVTNSPAGGTTTVSGTTASVTGLTAGTLYTFTVTATYATAPGGDPATVQATPLASQVVLQDITVTRPNGALVFTQVCGVNGALAAEAATSNGFPAVAAVPADSTGTAPTLSDGTPDPKFGEYPYPENADGTSAANYPTKCGVALGNAKFVKSGPGGGKFFAASGVLNQVTVVDTRDTDDGWNATGTMGTFMAGTGKSFSGSQLGWTPVRTSDTEAFTDSDGNVYDQTVAAGAAVLPNSPNAVGLSAGRALGVSAAKACTVTTAPTNCTGGLGTAVLDARLKLLIPVTAKSGNYTGTLTISAI